MASTSKSEPLGHHEEEKEEAKKQFRQARYIAFVVVAIIVVMSLAMGIIWAVVQPKRPQVVVENGYIVDGTETISQGDTSLSGRFLFEVNFSNPNKKATIYYDTLNATSSFTDKTKIVKSLNQSFILLPHQSFPVNFSFRASVRSMFGYMRKYQSQGRLGLNILFYAKLRFGFAKWKSQPRTILIDCSPLVVLNGNNFKPTACKVDY